MRMCLVFTREIEVDIGGLVAVESEECFKRDIVPVADHRRAALRTVFGREVKARTNGTVCKKLAVLALGADVMRRQRVDLRNSRSMRNKR